MLFRMCICGSNGAGETAPLPRVFPWDILPVGDSKPEIIGERTQQDKDEVDKQPYFTDARTHKDNHQYAGSDFSHVKTVYAQPA